MARYNSITRAAQFLGCDPKTVKNWVDRGFIPIYRSGGSFLVDLDEIEAAFKTNSRMRDPRRPKFGQNAKVVALPRKIEAYDPAAEASAGLSVTGEPRTIASVNDVPEGR